MKKNIYKLPEQDRRILENSQVFCEYRKIAQRQKQIEQDKKNMEALQKDLEEIQKNIDDYNEINETDYTTRCDYGQNCIDKEANVHNEILKLYAEYEDEDSKEEKCEEDNCTDLFAALSNMYNKMITAEEISKAEKVLGLDKNPNYILAKLNK